MNRISTVSSAANTRLFFALWPDASAAKQLQAQQQGLNGKKAARDDFHLTLHFLGEQPTELLPKIIEAGRSLTFSESLSFNFYGFFTHGKIVWAGLAEIPRALFVLHADLAAQLRNIPLKWRQEPYFIPHITLARKADRPSNHHFEPITSERLQFCLARSKANTHQFGSGEPRYEILQRF
ncbi:MAG TPA: RNA 2',3'-cyclic phosphodiesterase [Burkholderiaceae bacterium]|nr:RNA 2',3'-cyclic phosphodiesterase [Burkholderiaceae bacterium]